MKTAMTALTLRNPVFLRSGAVVCLALFLVLQIFAGSDALHKTIHPDAAAPGHQCAITLLAHGQVSPPNLSPALVIFVSALFALSSVLHGVFISSFACRLSHCRAPPRF